MYWQTVGRRRKLALMRDFPPRLVLTPMAFPIRFRPLLMVGLLSLGVGGTAHGDEPVDYLQEIRPLLWQRCTSCHGAVRQQSGLRLDTAVLARQGGEGGPAVVPGQPAESLLLDAVRGTPGVARMPPEGEPLSAAEIERLERWIQQGAVAPAETTPADPAKHWSFQSPVRPPVPTPARGEWSQNPIDRFVAIAQERAGVRPHPPAERGVLLRRLCFDLTGLPPKPEELAEFLADDRPDAFERVVDRLLESPQYGERWGRHLMDVWRYSDWDGHGAEVRESKPHIWRWRDWIVESLNADRGYDQMVVEMLAGDELAPEDPQTLRATGFLVRNWFLFNRNVWLEATVEHTSKAFLGLTFNCARCHDHMYDPFSQADYYRLRAFFETHDVRTDRVPGQPDPARDGLVRVFDAHGDRPTFLFRRGDEQQPVSDQPLAPDLPALLKPAGFRINPISLPGPAQYPGLQEFQRQEAREAALAAVTAAHAQRSAALTGLQSAREKLAQATAARPAVESASVPRPAVTLLEDQFTDPTTDQWQPIAGDWTRSDGKLRQSAVQNRWSMALASRPISEDFVLSTKFRVTEGQIYKSLGVALEAVDGDNLHGVYLSVSGKVQLFHRVQGVDSYPQQALKMRPVEAGREYTLKVALLGRLLNVWVDGEFQFAAELPGERPAQSRIGLLTYDAAAEFDSVLWTTLPSDLTLLGPDGQPAGAAGIGRLQEEVIDAERGVAQAERRLATATAGRVWVEARLQADRAAFDPALAALATDLATTASLAERDHGLRQAEENLLAAETKLLVARRKAGDATAVPAAEQALATASKARDEALAATTQPATGYTRFGPSYPATSTGRRLALARAITDRSNPLTARVLVNHLWLRHLGQPLVPTVFDFGLNGQPPTHPELLDWLAVELMDGGWRMKAIHRLIVTSQTWRQQSGGGADSEANRAIDPDNRWLWRANARRLEAEAVRDATLAVSGVLSPSAGGPEIDEGQGLTNPRRSLYFRNSKEKKMTFLDTFDRPNVVDCYRRSESIVPQQALALVNSSLTLAESRRLAATLSAEVGSTPDRIEAFVDRSFQRVLGRGPSATERAECLGFVATQGAKYASPEKLTKFTTGGAVHIPPATDPHQRARENLVHVLLNHNDFLTLR